VAFARTYAFYDAFALFGVDVASHRRTTEQAMCPASGGEYDA
jgi:hypothetical protein